MFDKKYLSRPIKSQQDLKVQNDVFINALEEDTVIASWRYFTKGYSYHDLMEYLLNLRAFFTHEGQKTQEEEGSKHETFHDAKWAQNGRLLKLSFKDDSSVERTLSYTMNGGYGYEWCLQDLKGRGVPFECQQEFTSLVEKHASKEWIFSTAGL